MCSLYLLIRVGSANNSQSFELRVMFCLCYLLCVVQIYRVLIISGRHRMVRGRTLPALPQSVETQLMSPSDICTLKLCVRGVFVWALFL